MSNSQAEPEAITFSGSMRADAFTAQLFVSLIASSTAITIKTMGRSYRIEREWLRGLEETSILGIFKRGIRFHHNQP
ncbi:MAG: hypothetical protein WBD20_04560, partial [Pirellulaceae bacterium]